MSEKTPRLKPSQATSRPVYDPAMVALARRGAEFYHPPLNPDQQRAAGQLSFMRTVETPEEIGGVGWPE